MNLHVLTREGLERARVAFADPRISRGGRRAQGRSVAAAGAEPLIDVEHRGEGDCEVDEGGVVATIAALLGVALASLGEGESLWMRSSGVDAAELAVDLRWRGEEPDRASLAEACALAEKTGGRVVREELGDWHLGLRLARVQRPSR